MVVFLWWYFCGGVLVVVFLRKSQDAPSYRQIGIKPSRNYATTSLYQILPRNFPGYTAKDKVRNLVTNQTKFTARHVKPDKHESFLFPTTTNNER